MAVRHFREYPADPLEQRPAKGEDQGEREGGGGHFSSAQASHAARLGTIQKAAQLKAAKIPPKL